MTNLEKIKRQEQMREELVNIGKIHKLTDKAKVKLTNLMEEAFNMSITSRAKAHPDILNEDGSLKKAWCRYMEAYYPVEEMTVSKGKSKGASKQALAVWNKTQKLIKNLATEFVGLDDFTSTEALELQARITLKRGDRSIREWGGGVNR